MAGTILKDIGIYKDKILSEFLNSTDIQEILLSGNPTTQNADNLLYSQIFPCLYVDDAETSPLTCLCVEVDISSIPSKTIKTMQITIWSYCHKDELSYAKTGYFGTRYDILADLAERIIRNSNLSGIGNLHLESVTNFTPRKDYYGRQIIFTVPDFKIKDTKYET